MFVLYPHYMFVAKIQDTITLHIYNQNNEMGDDNFFRNNHSIKLKENPAVQEIKQHWGHLPPKFSEEYFPGK